MPPSDSSLSAVLRRSDPASDAADATSADFAAGVRARIRAAEAAHSRPLSIFARLPYPLAAALALLASLGAGTSLAVARERSARAETFAAAYVRSIDPLQMHPAADSHAHR
jgi:hypothetical protein